jgi:hypothetical protein
MFCCYPSLIFARFSGCIPISLMIDLKHALKLLFFEILISSLLVFYLKLFVNYLFDPATSLSKSQKFLHVIYFGDSAIRMDPCIILFLKTIICLTMIYAVLFTFGNNFSVARSTSFVFFMSGIHTRNRDCVLNICL